MAKSTRKLNISKQAYTNADYKAAHQYNSDLNAELNQVAAEATGVMPDYSATHPGDPADNAETPTPEGWSHVETSVEQADTSEPVQSSALESVIQDITATPTPKPPRVYSNRTETRVQLYPFANLSVPDGAYLRFWASFVDQANPLTHVVTFDNIRKRCVHIAGRNPHPAAGGKNGCTDHARSKRLYEAGFIHPVSDGFVRIGFTFTDKARNSRDYHLGLADEYCPETGRLLVLAS